MSEFPDKCYGRCPLGHNPKPTTDTGDNLSTELIGTDEWTELVWSNYHQTWVCKMHKREEADLIHADKFREKDAQLEKERQGMGIIKNYSGRHYDHSH